MDSTICKETERPRDAEEERDKKLKRQRVREEDNIMNIE